MSRDTFTEERRSGLWLLFALLAFIVLIGLVLLALGFVPVTAETAASAPEALREPILLIANVQDLTRYLIWGEAPDAYASLSATTEAQQPTPTQPATAVPTDEPTYCGPSDVAFDGERAYQVDWDVIVENQFLLNWVDPDRLAGEWVPYPFHVQLSNDFDLGPDQPYLIPITSGQLGAEDRYVLDWQVSGVGTAVDTNFSCLPNAAGDALLCDAPDFDPLEDSLSYTWSLRYDAEGCAPLMQANRHADPIGPFDTGPGAVRTTCPGVETALGDNVLLTGITLDRDASGATVMNASLDGVPIDELPGDPTAWEITSRIYIFRRFSVDTALSPACTLNAAGDALDCEAVDPSNALELIGMENLHTLDFGVAIRVPGSCGFTYNTAGTPFEVVMDLSGAAFTDGE